jgi:hypothetical protein
VLAAVALWWPATLSGAFDGFPLDAPSEAIALGVLFPALWWFAPSFLSRTSARAAIIGLIALKAATTATMPQDGWCVAFDTPRPVAKDSTGRPHSWDVRADWRADNPACSAVMTRAYVQPHEFPAWFLNLAPPSDNPPEPTDRPPLATFDLHVRGYVSPRAPGELEIVIGEDMRATVVVDGRAIDRVDPVTHHVALAAGPHAIAIDATLTGERWRLLPVWNGNDFGTRGFPAATLSAPSTLDSAVRPLARMLLTLVAGVLIAGWSLAWLIAVGDAAVLTTAAAASLCLGLLASQPLTALSAWAVSGLAIAALLDVPTRLRNVRGVFLLVGVPWLTWVAAANARVIGHYTLYSAGDDWWTFQRYAYRIFLQGYWLEGGQQTFWFQPLYRWIAGALHIAFGDSSFGEFMWDGACVLSAALFAYHATRLVAGFRWGIAAAVLTLTIVMQGPGWTFIGRGLSELTSAGFFYLAAQVALRHRLQRFSITPGALATLGFYTRLNNMVMAIGVMAFALPMRVPARAIWHPRRLWRAASSGVMLGVPAGIAVGLLLFAWRTWHYTGVFSVFHGTPFGMLSIWQSGLAPGAAFARTSGSLMMVLTMTDPPAYNAPALPLLVAAIASVGALLGVPLLRDLPLAGVLFFLSGCAGALVARGSAYPGRFSLHLIGIASALTICCVAMAASRLARALSRSSRFKVFWLRL